eukprot:6397216-Prymnesium_polylepis.1
MSAATLSGGQRGFPMARLRYSCTKRGGTRGTSRITLAASLTYLHAQQHSDRHPALLHASFPHPTRLPLKLFSRRICSQQQQLRLLRRVR